MIVLDAGSWVMALVDEGPRGAAARRTLGEDRDWLLPAHGSIEVLRTLRRYETTGALVRTVVDRLAAEVVGAEVRIGEPDAALLDFVWPHRFALSPYDAPYVALASRYGVAIVTHDLRLARAADALGVAVIVPEARRGD